MIQDRNAENIKWINAFVLIIMSVVTVFAISPWSAWSLDKQSHAYGWNLFSYFTVQSNFIAVITYLIAAFAIINRREVGVWFRYLRGGAVLYMIITGLVSALLLQGAEVNPTPDNFNWSNFVLHEMGPMFIVIWWLIWPSKLAITYRQASIWLIFPFVWTIYTFIRASITGWYPYPFLNPDRVGGWDAVVVYIVFITVGFILFSQLIAWISRMRANNQTLY